jgi:hypothetical protein
MRSGYIVSVFSLAVSLGTPGAAAPPPSTLSVAVLGAGSVLSNSPGIDCPGDCTESYTKGTLVSLSALPDPGQTFSRWEGACVGSEPICNLKMASSRVVTAVFASNPTAPVPQTGQLSCWDGAGNLIPCAGTGQDGEIRAGVAWPSPRFTDNGNGTVTDTLTRLIWLKDGGCINSTWVQSLLDVKTLASGQCGLTDNSVSGDWRMPNIKEIESLLDYETGGLPLGHPFINMQNPKYFWSSTTDRDHPRKAWAIRMGYYADAEERFRFDKVLNAAWVFPVKGP